MEINLGNNIGGNLGVAAEAAAQVPAKVENPKVKTLDVSTASRSTFDPVKGSEPTADVPDSALNRDDELGKLVNAVFSFQPPPMPDFAANFGVGIKFGI